MDNFLMKPKVDFAFKEIMTNEKARTGFLSAMLKIKFLVSPHPRHGSVMDLP